LELELGDEGIAYGLHAHGNEHWGFGDAGRMRRRDESTNNYYIDASGRYCPWER
jgi:nuclear transport factor 2 (NTF2) superfamily protein